MLINTSHVIGLPIFSIVEGKNIHKVEDVVYDPSAQRIQALIVDSGSFFSEGRAVDIDAIKSIGEDAVVIQSESQLKNLSELEQSAKRIAKDDTYLTKSTVMTEEGKNLGKVVDLLFDPHTGRVEELEVSQGGLRDMQSGRKRVKPTHIVTVGQDAIIVSSFTEVAFEAQAEQKGAQGMLNQVRQTTEDAVETIKQKWEAPETQERIENTKTSIAETVDQGKENIQNVAQDTQEKLNQAKDDPNNQQKLEDLKVKATQAAQEIKMKTVQAKEETGEQISEQKQNVQDQMQQRSQQQLTAQENMAVGQYITRNILDQHDKVIARRGQMVTHGIVHQAKQSGQLNSVMQNLSVQPLAGNYAGALGGEVSRDQSFDQAADDDREPIQPS